VKASLMITCLGDALFPRVGLAAVNVLRALGVAVDFPATQVCCGQAAFNSGYRAEARRSAEAYLRAFAASEHVVSISGSCAAMVCHHYPGLFAGSALEADAGALAERTYEFSQFLTDVLNVERLPVRYDARVTLHHSCHTLRMLGVKDQPERLLSMVEGLEYVPLARADECCGFGGTYSRPSTMLSSRSG